MNKKSLIELAKEHGYSKAEFKDELMSIFGALAIEDLESPDNKDKVDNIVYLVKADSTLLTVAIRKGVPEGFLEEVGIKIPDDVKEKADNSEQIVVDAIKAASNATKH